jgi:hypothetical protein
MLLSEVWVDDWFQSHGGGSARCSVCNNLVSKLYENKYFHYLNHHPEIVLQRIETLKLERVEVGDKFDVVKRLKAMKKKLTKHPERSPETLQCINMFVWSEGLEKKISEKQKKDSKTIFDEREKRRTASESSQWESQREENASRERLRYEKKKEMRVPKEEKQGQHGSVKSEKESENVKMEKESENVKMEKESENVKMEKESEDTNSAIGEIPFLLHGNVELEHKGGMSWVKKVYSLNEERDGLGTRDVEVITSRQEKRYGFVDGGQGLVSLEALTGIIDLVSKITLVDPLPGGGWSKVDKENVFVSKFVSAALFLGRVLGFHHPLCADVNFMEFVKRQGFLFLFLFTIKSSLTHSFQVCIWIPSSHVCTLWFWC